MTSCAFTLLRTVESSVEKTTGIKVKPVVVNEDEAVKVLYISKC